MKKDKPIKKKLYIPLILMPDKSIFDIGITFNFDSAKFDLERSWDRLNAERKNEFIKLIKEVEIELQRSKMKKTSNVTKIPVDLKDSLQQIGRLKAQRKQLDNQISKLLKTADSVINLGDGFFQRRNVLFVDFNKFEDTTKNDSDVSIDESLDLVGSGFPSSEDSISNFDERNTIDTALKNLEDVMSVINQFKAELKRAKENGCDYLVDYNYTNPKDFDFEDDEDNDD